MNHCAHNWKDLTEDMLKEDNLQRTYVKITKFYHSSKMDKKELEDGALEWFYEEISKYLNRFT
jgi:hypothetical protein